MFPGILSGALSALLMSGSFVVSRTFIRKYGSPIRLAVQTQIIMGIGGLITLLACLYHPGYPSDPEFYMYLAGEVVFFMIGQTSFFMMIRDVEASRAASLLGLKIFAIALISSVIGKPITPTQWVAVLLCTISAVGMNLSGIRLPLKSFFWLFLSVLFYALCDTCLTGMVGLMPGNSVILNSIGVLGLTFTVLGVLLLPMLRKYPFSGRSFPDAVPYSVFYFLAMIFLITSFGLLGVVFASIIQAGRGILSILLCVILLKLGLEKNEPQVSVRLWLQRLLMAVSMLAAMTIYSCSAAKIF